MTTKEKKGDQKKEAGVKGNTFPWGDFEGMAEMMRKCSEDPEKMSQCCTMMQEMMKGKTKSE